MKKTQLSVFGSLLLGTSLCAQGFQVDVSRQVGTIRFLGDVNCGPVMNRRPPNPPVDFTHWYRLMRIQTVRTHDFYGPFDLSTIYPDETKDPTKSSSYNFANSDKMAKALVASGAKIYLRLGNSWNAPKVPKNMANAAEACLRILMHYRSAWAKGFRYDIPRVEVWNEPNGRFWRGQGGTASQFYAFYAMVAKKIRAYDPKVQVGASGIAGNAPGDYREKFVSYCLQNKVPLDFFSWHLYTRGPNKDPFAFAREARANEAWLKKMGLSAFPQHLTEWNLDLGSSRHPMFDNLQGAAFMTAARIYLQDSPVRLAHLYRGDGFPSMGLFDSSGRPKPRASARVLSAFLRDSSLRLSSKGGDQKGWTLLAGTDGKGLIQVLGTRYQGSSSGTSLNFSGLTAGWYRLDDFNVGGKGDLQWASSQVLRLPQSFRFVWPGNAPWVRLLRLRRLSTAGPDLALSNSLAPTENLKFGLRLEAGKSFANKAYVLLFSLSGTSPGFVLPGGLRVQLNPDPAMSFLLGLAGTTLAPGTVGVLDSQGSGKAGLDLGAVPPGLKGKDLASAAVLLDSQGFLAVSPPRSIHLR
jgi:hypothetical protein